MTEFIKSLGHTVEEEFGSWVIANIIVNVVEEKEGVMAEASFARRISVMVQANQIQFVPNFPADEPEELIDWRAHHAKEGYIIFLVINPEFVARFLEDKNQEELLYGKLKECLLLGDEIHHEQGKILNRAEYLEIKSRQRQIRN